MCHKQTPTVHPWCRIVIKNVLNAKNLLCPCFQEMLGELFTPIETPEAQNRGFLKGFFGGNANTFDREELCVFFSLFFLFHCMNSVILLHTNSP